MNDGDSDKLPSPFVIGLLGRCPRCGTGRLFKGYLSVAERCDHCGLDYGFIDSGDGPAVFIVLIAGFVVTGLALFVEVSYQPALWLHAALWLPLGIGLPLLLLRPFKATLLALQYRYKAEEARHTHSDDERNLSERERK
ncbi:MAG: DUF983 domain-containing protein [Hyphomicrobiales bacterium]|nr:DUF983 domain-containing protein [Hyphomicrobiales bacterium]